MNEIEKIKKLNRVPIRVEKPEFTKKMIKDFQQMNVKDRDKLKEKTNLFVGFPRAGMHWMLNMYILVTGRENWSRASKPYLLNRKQFVYKSHRLPEGLGAYTRGKVFYMYKHGKDAVLAYSKFMHHIDWAKGKHNMRYDEKWLEHCILERKMPEKWVEHIDAFFEVGQRSDCDFYSLKFEDALVDPLGELKKLIKWMGYGDPKDATYEAVEIYMAKSPKDEEVIFGNEKKGFLRSYYTGANALIYGKSTPEERVKNFTRRWETFKYWTPAIDKLVNNIMGKTLVRYGYEL